MTALDKDRIEVAASTFRKAAMSLLTVDDRVHVDTLLSSLGRMAGSMMYRTFGFREDIAAPGSPVLSDLANTEGPKLMNMMLDTLRSLGHDLNDNNINRDYLSAEYTHLSFKEAHDRLAPVFLNYCQQTKTPIIEGAYAGAVALAQLIHEARDVLSVDKGAALAIHGFVEGTKTVPFPVVGIPAEGEKKKPWYKIW